MELELQHQEPQVQQFAVSLWIFLGLKIRATLTSVSKIELLQYYYSHFLAKAVPFRLEFYSDGYEWAPSEGAISNKGAKIYYFQTTC